MNTGCLRCGRLPGNSHTEICALQGEIERLRHDIERHIAIASELATENERLRAELRKPDCRLCEYCGQSTLTAKFRCLRQPPIVCINGDAHIPLRALRLYKIDAAMAGGEK